MTQKTELTVETLALGAGNKVLMPAGAAGGIVGWLASINWIGLSSIAIALLGLLLSFYFQRRRDKREQAEFEARQQREQLEHRLRVEEIRARERGDVCRSA